MTFTDAIREHARTRGTATALSDADRSVSYAELDARADLVAGALRSAGISHADRVAYVGENTVDFVELFAGAARARAVTVPLDRRLATAELAALVAGSGAVLTVLDAGFAAVGPALPGPVLLTGGPFRKWTGRHGVPKRLRSQPGDVVLQLYPEGMGVRLDGSDLAHFAGLGPRYGLEAGAVSVAAVPVCHLGGTARLLAGLYAGAHTVLVRDADPAALVEPLDRAVCS